MTLYEYLENVLSKHNKKINDISQIGGRFFKSFNDFLDFLKTTDYFGRSEYDWIYNDDSVLVGLNLWVKKGNLLEKIIILL